MEASSRDKKIEVSGGFVRLLDLKTGRVEKQIPLEEISSVNFTQGKLSLGQRGKLFGGGLSVGWSDRSQDDAFREVADAIRVEIDPSFATIRERAGYVISKAGEFGIGGSHPGEIEELPKILEEGEEIRFMTAGYCEYKGYESGSGLWVATDKRLIFIDKGIIGQANYICIPYDQIKPEKSRIDWDGEVKLSVRDLGVVEMERISREDRKKLVDEIMAGCKGAR